MDSLEAVVGFVADPIFGQTLAVGSGGALVEIVGDAATAIAPLNLDAARALVDGTRLAMIASGYRNLVPTTPTRELSEIPRRCRRFQSTSRP